MGSSSSKIPDGAIGVWSSGKAIFEGSTDIRQAQLGIQTGKYQPAGADSVIPTGRVKALIMKDQSGNEVLYHREANAVERWWFSNKPKLAAGVATTAKVSAGIALQAVDIALPVLLNMGREAAKNAITSKMPGSEQLAGPLVDALAKQVEATAHEGARVGMDNLYGDTAAGNVARNTMDTSLVSGSIQQGASAIARKHAAGEPAFYNHMSDYAYLGALETCGGDITGGYDGACGCGRPDYLGAEDLDTVTVRDYTNSINSKAKSKIIDDILEVGTKLGMKISGDSLQSKIKSMLEQMPSGDKFKANDETHKKVCMGIAEAINRTYGNTVINKDLPTEVICQHVAEIVSSLAAGMHSEFLAVFNDVRKVLKNLHILKNALKDDHEAIVLRIKDSDDELLPQQITTLNDLHNILTDEVDRQIQLLSNLLNISLFPADKELSSLIKSKKDLHGYIEKIDVKIGSDRFGKVISDILKGLGLTANFALLIERSLKTVGLTLDEYAKNDSVQKLREKITQNLMDKKLDESQLHEYLEAAELLYRNFYRNQDIVKTLEASKSGKYDPENMDFTGGNDVYPKTSMDKRVADRKKLRNLIFNTFYRQVNEYFDKMVGNLDILTLKIGTEIPLSDQLNSLRHVLQRVDEGLVRNKNIYYALIGYYNDAMSKSKKDSLLADLKMVSSYIDTILEMPLYSASKGYFIAVQSQIKAITDLIDRFSDEIAAKFGRGDDADPACAVLEKEGGYDLDAVYGGNSSLTSLETEPRIMYKSTKSIHDSIRQFDYKFRVAQIQSNMAATGKELQHYGEKYEKIIANSIADILNDDKKVYDKLRKNLDDNSLFDDESKYVVNNDTAGFENKENVAKERQAAMKFLDSQWDAKKRFWATVEAVDSYMRVFTDALVKNPGDIKEIKSMLDEVEVINDWYSDKTGNDLAGVFDFFPSYQQGGSLTTNTAGAVSARDLVYPPANYRNESVSESHYYRRVRDQLNTPVAGVVYNTPADVTRSAYPGNPHLVTIPTYGEQAKAQVKKMLSGLGVLKNLLSVFVHVGAKFGGEELRKKIFMSPAQMYNNLVDYIQASAFAQGFGVGDMSTAVESELPMEFSTSDNMAVEMNLRTGDFVDGSAVGGRAVWANRTTYPGGGLVHLGVTADNSVAVHDYNYSRNPIAPALVGKINAATDDMINVLNQVGARGVGVGAPDLGLNLRDVRGPPHGPTSQVWATNTTGANRALLFKKRWGIWMRSILGGLKSQEGFSFKREDDYFVLLMKSLAAKVLTVTGMYDVLDRPMEYNGLSPIRMITGGAVETPKVDDGAVPLYFRLPLLAQFYRGIFGFNDPEDSKNKFTQQSDWRGKDKNIKISMVPDVDGTFAGLIRLVFRKTKYVNNNAYSDEDIKEIIREVNLIYQRMQAKYPQNTVMETIHEFVAEINRRYGIVSLGERNEYEREFGQRYDYSKMGSDPLHPGDRYTEAPTTDIALLPGEGEEEVVRPSSAQKLLGETFDSVEKKRLFTISTQHRDLVYRFRCAIDKYFENPDEEITFNHAIKAVQLKLKREQNDESRFKIVSSLVRGVDVYSKVDGMKYVMFHETVVGGLNMLSAVHTMLARFKRRAHLLDLGGIEEQIWKYFETAGLKVVAGQHSLCNHIHNYLTKELGIADDNNQTMELVMNLFGKGEAFEWNGGHLNSVATAKEHALKGGNGVPIVDAANPANPVYVGRESVARANTFGVVDNATHGNFKAPGTLSFSTQQGGNNNDPLGNPQGGLTSILAGWGVKQLKDAYYSKATPQNRDAKRVAETFMRFIFGREWVMKELLESLFGFGHDFQGLVEVKIDDGKLYLSYSGLKAQIEEMFQHVSYFLDLLRPHIKPELIARYTDKYNPGSYYWLQEQLIEKILVGRPAPISPLPDETTARVGYASLDELMQKLTYTWQVLNREYDTDGSRLYAGAVGAGGGHVGISQVNVLAAGTKSKNNFDKVFAELIFYDASRPCSGLLHSEDSGVETNTIHEALGGVKIVDFIRNQYDALHFNGPAGAKVLDTRYAARFYQLYSWKNELTLNRSALFAFNQLVAKFIQTFYDPVPGKIYAGLINQFANGVFNRAVADQLFTYPDTAPLWFVKSVSGADMKIPNTYQMNAMITNPTTQALVTPLKGLIEQYLKYGVIENDENNADHASLLKPSDPRVGNIEAGLTLIGTANGAVANNTPSLYVNLLAHIVAKVIAEWWRLWRINGAGAAPANPVKTLIDHALGGQPGAGTIADYLNAYGEGTNTPTLKQVINTLFNGNNIVAKLNQIGRHQSIPNNRQAYDSGVGGGDQFKVANRSSLRVVAAANTGISVELINCLDQVLRLPGMATNSQENWGSITILAAKIFPHQDDALGHSDREREYRAELYAQLLAALAEARTEAFLVNTAAGADKKMKELSVSISGAVLGTKSTYVSTGPTQPRLLVKYDDIMLASDQYASQGDPAGLADAGFLVHARAEPVGQVLKRNNIADLGVTGPAGNPSDNLADMMKFGRRLDPDGDHILFTSLAVILKNLVSSRNTVNQSAVYLQDNVADIPLYMKEKMRANLPAFRNLFKELVTRCEFLKKFMARPELSLERVYTGIATSTPAHNPWPYVLKPLTTTSAGTKSQFTNICDGIVRGCAALITTCDQVLREVGDDAKYFELYQNSIKDYKAQYGFDPLMPLSSTLAVLKNVDKTSYLDFFPIHSLGETQFKFMYGTRSLISQPTAAPLMEHAGGFSQIVDSFNLIIDTKMTADKARADGFLKTFVKLLRYVHELKHVKGLLTPHIFNYATIAGAPFEHPNELIISNTVNSLVHIDGAFNRDDLVLTNKIRGIDTDRTDAVAHMFSIHNDRAGASTGPIILTNKSDVSLVTDGKNKERAVRYGIKREYPLPVYAISKSLEDTIKLTESSFRDDKIKELVEYLCEYSKRNNSLEIQNIIDLNIVPINVHALMREIPLVNLYNYAYTFDRLIIELYYGLKNDNARKLIGELCDYASDDGKGALKRITSAKDMLVALLLNPYLSLFEGDDNLMRESDDTTHLYERFAKDMLVGVANNGELGRPKFLSDQVYNKAVFGEMYAARDDYNEMGPSAGRIARVKINSSAAVQLYAQLIYTILVSLNSGGNLQNLVLAGPVAGSDRHLLNFCTAVARYMAENPNADLTDVKSRIVDKFLDNANGKGVAEFKALRTAANDNGSKYLALYAGIVAILIREPIATFVNSVNSNGFSQANLQTAANRLSNNLLALNGISLNGGATAQLGSGAGAGAVAATLQAIINGVAPADSVTALPALQRLEVVDDLPVAAAAGGNATVPTAVAIAQSMDVAVMSLAPQDAASFDGAYPGGARASLHWLDTNPIHNSDGDYQEPGVGLQKNPRGDNANVLDPTQVKSVAIPDDLRQVLAAVGRLRFDTVFLRNLIFIVNLYRSLRMKLQRDLVYNKDVILRSAPITRVQLTEFFGNQVDQGRQSYRDSQMWNRYNY